MLRLPEVRCETAADHLHRGGFAGAVGAEQAEGFPGGDAEGDAVDGGDVAIAFGEVLGGDDVLRSGIGGAAYG